MVRVWVQLFTGVLTGVVFGLAVQKCRVYEPATIRDQFTYSRFIMLKMFLSALTTSITCFCLLYVTPGTQKHFTRIRHSYMACLNRKGALLSATGGAILGAGMALSASCPGIVLAQVGSYVPNAAYTLLGCLMGVILYTATHASLTNILAGQKGHTSQTLDEYLGIPYPLLGASVAIMTSSVVVIFESLFPWQKELQGWNEDGEGSLLSRTAWPPYVGGIVVGVLQLPLSMCMGDTVGGSQSYCTLVSQFLMTRDLERKVPYLAQYKRGVHNWWQVLFVSGAVAGAYMSSVGSGTLGTVEGVSPAAAFIGGVLMLYGARMAGGCTSGHGLSGLGLMMALSIVTVPAMFAGGTVMGLGLRYLGNT